MIWLGFGDVSGEDFWRNRASIRHDQFSENPAMGPAGVTWTTEATMLRRDGVCVANPLGRASMKQGAPSRVPVLRGQTLTLRFVVIVHSSPSETPIDLAAIHRGIWSR